MKRSSLALLLAAPLVLGGCVIHVGADDDGRYVHSDSRKESRNRDAISRLALGTPLDQIFEQLGEPDFAEAMTVGGREMRVLRYRTHRARADGDTTRDETTPLVFSDGKLTGIGEAAAAQAMTH